MIGIIAEYNPFHNGHKYHIEQARAKAGGEPVVVIMSGNFVQRGESAIYDKYSRTRAALLCGADIVLELPIFYATAHAEIFARGAVGIFAKLRAIKHLAFGTEAENLEEIEKASAFLTENESGIWQNIRAQKLTSHPTARAEAVARMGGDATWVSSPNNILAIEYIRAINRYSADIRPVAIKREGGAYHSTDLSEIPSATAIRKHLFSGNTNALKIGTPNEAHEIFSRLNPVHTDRFSEILRYKLLVGGEEWLNAIAGAVEGIENRVIREAESHTTFTALAEAVKTKRYTYAAVSRLLTHALLGITKADYADLLENGTPYVRVLGFRKSSASVLSELAETAKIPVITNFKHAPRLLDSRSMGYLERDIQASDIYYIAAGISPREARRSLVML